MPVAAQVAVVAARVAVVAGPAPIGAQTLAQRTCALRCSVPATQKLPWSSGVFKGLSEDGCISHDEAERLFPGPPAASFAEAHHDPPKPPVVPPPVCPLSLMVQPASSKVVVEDVPAVDEDAIKKEAEAWKAKGPNRTSSPLRPPTPPTPPPEDAPTPTPSPQPAPAPAPTPAFDYSRFDKLNVSDSDDETQEHAHEFVDEVLKEGRKLFSDGPPGSPPAPALSEIGRSAGPGGCPAEVIGTAVSTRAWPRNNHHRTTAAIRTNSTRVGQRRRVLRVIVPATRQWPEPRLRLRDAASASVFL